MVRNFLPAALLVSFAAASCNSSQAPEVDADAATATAPVETQAVIYKIAPTESKVAWVGSKLVGDKHSGTINVTDGMLAFDGTTLAAGDFTIDMTSLAVTDLDEAGGKGKLEGHLKNADFFEVDKFPTAKFTIAQVQPDSSTPGITHQLTGNLEMKGVSKSVTIPANIQVTADAVTATTPAFQIDRNDWGVKYGSGLSGAVGDNVISDDVELTINLRATRS